MTSFFSQRRLRPEVVTREAWLKRLHWRMYYQIWAWAGQYRTTERNLGVPYWQIRMDMRDIEADAHVWLADTSATRWSQDECAVRFVYRLVLIHPFPNETAAVTARSRPLTWLSAPGLPGAARR